MANSKFLFIETCFRNLLITTFLLKFDFTADKVLLQYTFPFNFLVLVRPCQHDIMSQTQFNFSKN